MTSSYRPRLQLALLHALAEFDPDWWVTLARRVKGSNLRLIHRLRLEEESAYYPNPGLATLVGEFRTKQSLAAWILQSELYNDAVGPKGMLLAPRIFVTHKTDLRGGRIQLREYLEKYNDAICERLDKASARSGGSKS